jgi:hypothetical protein
MLALIPLGAGFWAGESESNDGIIEPVAAGFLLCSSSKSKTEKKREKIRTRTGLSLLVKAYFHVIWI